jgi:hypothetical protein
MAVRIVTVLECEQNLHEEIPHRLLCNRPTSAARRLDDGRQVPAAAVFHNDIQDAGFAVDMSVDIAYNVVVIKILENIPMSGLGTPQSEKFT